MGIEKNKNRLISTLIMFLLLFNIGCNPVLKAPEISATLAPISQYEQDISLAETKFFVQVPEPISEELIFELIDDVTGIELNPTRYVMNKIGDLSYEVSIPLKIGSIAKYRFFRNGDLPIYETNSFNQIIDYRAVFINTANEFNDLISNWLDKQYDHAYGRIEGQVLNKESNSPLPSILVIAGGVQTFTNSLGNFAIEQLPPGKHTIIAISTDGEFQIFQQEAIIGENQTTSAKFNISPNEFVNVTFIVQSPKIDNQTMRMVGNTYQLGNVFANLFNGESTVASRAPILNSLPDGNYSATLRLPVGFNLIYKYTLGNGFWNAELSKDGKFLIRDIIVPSEDLIIHDFISTFQAPETYKIKFNLTVSQDTPEMDSVSIQFSPFGWSSPIPMTQVDRNQYSFTLYGPLNMVDNVEYRYCRNDACNISTNTLTDGNENISTSFSSSDIEQVINDEIISWKNWAQEFPQTEIIAPQINNRSEDFLVGFEQSTEYTVFTPIFGEEGYSSMREINANVVVIPLVWTLHSLNPVILSPEPGQNPLWKDAISQISKAKNMGLKVIIFPKFEFSKLAINQLFDNSFQVGWEEKFSSLYTEFLIYAADLAEFQDIVGLIIPTETIYGENLTNASMINSVIGSLAASQIPYLRTHYDGKFYISIVPERFNQEVTSFALFDEIIIHADWDIDQDGNDIESFTNAFREKFQNEIHNIYEVANLPITIFLDYPSAKGVENGCVIYEEECINFKLANDLTTSQELELEKDFNIQRDIYSAALTTINEIDWINGFISSGYNVQLSSRDATSSVRGKPAGDLLWYWYPNLIGK